MRKRNWGEYNKNLVQRGSLTFLIDSKSLKGLAPKRTKRKGRPQEYSPGLIEVLLLIKIHFKMPYRMLEGFTKYFLQQMKDIPVPTYSLVCKRAKSLTHIQQKLSARRPSTVIVDATGIKVCGEGEWKRKIHGKSGPRKWIKLHVIIDEKTQEIISEVSTASSVSDGKALPEMMRKVPRSAKTLIGDGAYDHHWIRALMKKRGGKVLAPPPKNGVCRGIDPDRDQAIKDIRLFGGDLVGRSLWGKLSGYSRRALVETTFSRYKRMFGGSLFSRTEERIRVENRLKCLLLNKMLQAG